MREIFERTLHIFLILLHGFLALWPRKRRNTLNKRKTKFALTCNVQKVIWALAFRSREKSNDSFLALIWFRGLDIYSLNRTRYIACTRDTPEGGR